MRLRLRFGESARRLQDGRFGDRDDFLRAWDTGHVCVRGDFLLRPCVWGVREESRNRTRSS